MPTRELLAVLLEAGEENLPTLVNTVLIARPGAAPDEVLAAVEGALAALERDGYVEYAANDGDWRGLTGAERAGVGPLAAVLGWDAAAGRWVWASPMLPPYGPSVILTTAGRAHARSLLR